MNHLLLCLSVWLQTDSTDFNKKIVNDFTRHAYYLAFDVKFQDYKGRVIIENDDLFSFFNTEGKLPKEEYTVLILNRLKTGDFEFEDQRIPERGFIKVPELPMISKQASKGSKKFINTYFNKRYLKSKVDKYERAAIINKLFEWKIASKIEDESGVLIISYTANIKE